MWTATIRDKGVQNEAITCQVEFVNGKESIVRNFAGNTKEEIDRRIQQQLDALVKRDENVDLVTVGEWTAPVEEPAPEPTPEEAARDAWLEKWREFAGAEKGIAALARNGITPKPEEQAAFDALKQWVADNRKPEYTHLITE